ncbi:hypothetical protein HZH68_001106 [Vespula germanica]|uniref:Uncharacterized protein n=1 Tax=Vespula germanica TaxID=30212 RepID=A0A834NUZ9_VESGE|nr:hypothetical protein HZH68_001106 [Vespula germanica]
MSKGRRCRIEIVRRRSTGIRFSKRLARISGPINHNYVNSGPVVARVRTSPTRKEEEEKEKENDEEEEKEEEEEEEEEDTLAENVRVEELGKNTAHWADALPTNLPLSSSSQRVDYPGPPWNFDGTGRPHRADAGRKSIGSESSLIFEGLRGMSVI